MVEHRHNLFGLLAQFATSEQLLEAAERTHAAGYQRVDAFSPYPVHGLHEAIGARRTRLPWIVFAGGVAGCLLGFFMQYYSAKFSYAINVGGKPYNSWPAFIPITFECTILLASFTAVVGMLVLNRLPMPVHPLFNVDAFSRVSRDRFFLCVDSDDPLFDAEKTLAFLKSLNAERVDEVPR